MEYNKYIVVYSYASIQQVGLVRQLGPGFYSSWAACGLLGTIALLALCLGEGIGSIVEWVGVITLVVTMTVCMNETSKWIDGCKSSSSSSTSNEQQQQKEMMTTKKKKILILRMMMAMRNWYL